MTLLIAFRVDSSLEIGSGHVMRCLTLADALRAKGAQCHFISRAHLGNLNATILQRGYLLISLGVSGLQFQKSTYKSPTKVQYKQASEHLEPKHTSWLGTTWQTDAQETALALSKLKPDWLVVDHYALDKRWEEALSCYCSKLLVIDDLADRPHSCNLLIDQNLGRQPQDYSGLVPKHCEVLIGPHYALLRSEFTKLRPYSLNRRKTKSALKRILITMGGVDQPNATRQVLKALKTSTLPVECNITVIMGFAAPWLKSVRESTMQMPWNTEVVVNANNMAHRMADCDLAIGAGGGTAWERCCLGLPSLMVVLADNQRTVARALHAAHAVRLIGAVSDIEPQLHLAVNEFVDFDYRARISRYASMVTDGLGVEKIIKSMMAVGA